MAPKISVRYGVFSMPDKKPYPAALAYVGQDLQEAMYHVRRHDKKAMLEKQVLVSRPGSHFVDYTVYDFKRRAVYLPRYVEEKKARQ